MGLIDAISSIATHAVKAAPELAGAAADAATVAHKVAAKVVAKVASPAEVVHKASTAAHAVAAKAKTAVKQAAKPAAAVATASAAAKAVTDKAHKAAAAAKPLAAAAATSTASEVQGALAGVTATELRGVGNAEQQLIRRLGGSEAVRVIARHAADSKSIRAYGSSPWKGIVRDLQVLDPAQVPGVARIFSGDAGALNGRWGALLQDVVGINPKHLAIKFNLGAAQGARALPTTFAVHRPKVGDILRVGDEGAKAFAGSPLDRLRTLGERALHRGAAPTQIEFLKYAGRNSSPAAKSFIGRFGPHAPVVAPDAASGAVRAGGALGSAGRVIGRAALPVAIGLSAFDVIDAYNREGEVGPDTRHAAGRGAGGIVGGIAGAALAGAAAGSVFPGIGTLAGFGVGLTGGIIGGLIGGELGEAASDAVTDPDNRPLLLGASALAPVFAGTGHGASVANGD